MRTAFEYSQHVSEWSSRYRAFEELGASQATQVVGAHLCGQNRLRLVLRPHHDQRAYQQPAHPHLSSHCCGSALATGVSEACLQGVLMNVLAAQLKETPRVEECRPSTAAEQAEAIASTGEQLNEQTPDTEDSARSQLALDELASAPGAAADERPSTAAVQSEGRPSTTAGSPTRSRLGREECAFAHSSRSSVVSSEPSWTRPPQLTISYVPEDDPHLQRQLRQFQRVYHPAPIKGRMPSHRLGLTKATAKFVDHTRQVCAPRCPFERNREW